MRLLQPKLPLVAQRRHLYHCLETFMRPRRYYAFDGGGLSDAEPPIEARSHRGDDATYLIEVTVSDGHVAARETLLAGE